MQQNLVELLRQNSRLYDLMDILMVPLALIIVFSLATLVERRLKATPYQSYLLPSLIAKLIGGIAVGVLYYYVYGGGDTFVYFDRATSLNLLLLESPGDYLSVMLASGHETIQLLADATFNHNVPYTGSLGPEEMIVVKVISVPALLAGNTYLATSIYLSFVSWLTILGLLRVFYHYFPTALSQIALATLFVPSVFFWGSGILKDCVTLSALAAVVYGLFRVFVAPRSIFLWTAVIVVAGNLILNVRDFILIGFTPFAAIWLLPTVVAKIKNPTLKILFGPLVAVVMLAAGGFLFTRVAQGSQSYNLDNVFATAYFATLDLHDDRYYVTSTGSRYELPGFDGTFAGALTALPFAIVTAFIRPWLWEIRSPVMALSAVESFWTLLLIIRTVIRVPPQRIIALTATNRMLLFMLLFSLFYGWMSALGSGNFGNLVRYKIPALPFFYGYFLLIYYYGYTLKVNTVADARKLVYQRHLETQESAVSQPKARPVVPSLTTMRDRIANRHRSRLAPGTSEPRV